MWVADDFAVCEAFGDALFCTGDGFRIADQPDSGDGP
jgi:hypothetical protein